MTTRRRVLGAVVALSVAVPGAALATGSKSSPRAAVHRTYRQTAAAYTARYLTPVAPGVDLAGFSSAAAGRTANSDLMTVDLTRPGVSTGILSDRVTDTANVATWAHRSGAVAAINGDYFDIGASQAPIGAVVRGGVLRKGLRAGQSMTGLGTDGALRTATVNLKASVSWNRSPGHPLDVYNSDLTGAMPGNGLAILDGGWGGAPLTFAHAPGKVAVVVVDAHHKVVRTTTKLSRVTVPPGGLLLIGTGSYQSIAKLTKNALVTDTIDYSTNAPARFSWGLGAGLLLISNGSVVHNYPNDTDPHDARTALGWSNGGHTMIVLTVEYGNGSVGEGVNEIADELAAAGATDAVLLDGGGSTTLVARQQGDASTGQIGPVSTGGGIERHVPIGIGVFVPKGSGRLDGFTLGLDAGTVFPGLHRQVTFRGYDEEYGPAGVDPAKVTLTTDNGGLLKAAGTGLVQAERTGQGHVIATSPTSAPGAPATASSSVFLQVLHPLTGLLTAGALRLTPNATVSLPLSGTDSTGATAPILASDVSASYDHSLLSVKPSGNGSLSIHALKVPEGQVTPLTLTVAGVTSTIVIHIGFATVPLLSPAAPGALHVTGGSGRVASLGHGVSGLRVGPSAATAVAIVAKPSPLPTGTARVGVSATGDGLKHAIGVVIVDAAGHQRRLFLGTLTGRASRHFEVAVPAGAAVVAVTVGRAAGKHGGSVTLTQLVART